MSIALAPKEEHHHIVFIHGLQFYYNISKTTMIVVALTYDSTSVVEALVGALSGHNSDKGLSTAARTSIKRKGVRQTGGRPRKQQQQQVAHTRLAWTERRPGHITAFTRACLNLPT
ncbi:hypothetical protein E2C01_036715 [Portunus trituberculatus]|uniref:Uncharacterized protein n=1 Tax=Portunus trituberculatus TaxID=210409 RepID=A0A5B7FDE5_PORTR|nr:hypothetical protein [Portunus trituberculatus]